MQSMSSGCPVDASGFSKYCSSRSLVVQGPTFAGGPVGFLTFPECEIVDHYKKGSYSFLNSHFCDGWVASGGGQGCITFAGSRWLPSQVPQLTSGYPAPTFTLHSPLQSDICPHTFLTFVPFNFKSRPPLWESGLVWSASQYIKRHFTFVENSTKAFQKGHKSRQYYVLRQNSVFWVLYF